jgi:AbrB family looped-hinge helix DNA binding protein
MKEQTIRVGKRGAVTLPSRLREKYGIQEGDILHLLDLEGVLVLTPMVPIVPELARQIEQMRLDEGLSASELLEGLRGQRHRYYLERFIDEDENSAGN